MKIAFAALVLVCTLATCSFACKCAPPPPPQEALKEAAAVFTATVEKMKQGEREHVVILKVQKSWKGVKQEKILVTTSSSSAACGVAFSDKSEWLIYASENPETKKLRASHCSRTKLIEDAEEELKELGKPIWEASSP